MKLNDFQKLSDCSGYNRYALRIVVPGALISDLDKKAENFITSQGARPAFKGYMGFPSTLCISIEDAVVHGIPGDIELKEGQIVGIDCWAEVNGYYGDHAKTFSVGKISRERKLMDITEESLYKGIEKAEMVTLLVILGMLSKLMLNQMAFLLSGNWLVMGLVKIYMKNPRCPTMAPQSRL